MKKCGRLISILLVIVMLAGIAPAYAADSSSTVTEFSDVPSTAYYAEAVKWAVENGITSGTGENKFSPANTVTRAEAVTFLWRVAGEPNPASAASPFVDVTDSNAYYYKAVLWAAEQGIASGVGGDMFNLNGTLPYDQIFAFLCRAAGGTSSGSNWSEAAVSWAEEKGLTDGLSFTAKADCPRADVVYCLWKQLANESVSAGLSDLEGARAAIINGFLQLEASIDVSAYRIEASELEALAAEIVNVEGYDNYYGVTKFWCAEQPGTTAKALQVWYQYYNLEVAEQHRAESTKVKEAVDRIISEVVEPGMSDYETAKALHDYLVLNCAYDMRLYSGNMPDTAYTAYGALVDGTAVCAGYAKAYQALLEACGIECEYVSGYGNGGRHGWNIVQIGGEWYHVDTTWDDPIPDREGYVRYNYFLKSDAVMGRDHSGWNSSHACTSTKYDENLADSIEQVEQVQQEEAKQEILAACRETLTNLPYTSEAELQAAEDLSYDDMYVYIYFSGEQFDAVVLQSTLDEAKAIVSAANSDFELMLLSSQGKLCYRIFRGDVKQELDRRQANQQAEQDANVREIEELLKEAIRNNTDQTYNFYVTGYTDQEVKKACRNLSADGYSFDGFTAGEDYRLTAQYNGWVIINDPNWLEEEILRKVEIIQDAIRSGQTEVRLLPGSYENVGDFYCVIEAADRVKADGYSFDSYTAGVDYTISRAYILADSDGDVYVVQIEYPNN